MEEGNGRAWLPDVLAQSYPNADLEFGWRFLFPTHTLSRDPRSRRILRHHLRESVLAIVLKRTGTRAKIELPFTAYALWHSFATHLLESGFDFRQQRAFDFSGAETKTAGGSCAGITSCLSKFLTSTFLRRSV